MNYVNIKKKEKVDKAKTCCNFHCFFSPKNLIKYPELLQSTQGVYNDK